MHKRKKLKSAVFLMILCPVITVAQILKLPETIQEQTEWCWAATSCAVLNYYGKGLSQCTIADYARTQITWHDFGTANCCDNPGGKCNYWNYNYGYTGSIEDILKHWEVKSSGFYGKFTINKIQTEIGAGRPFIIHWGYKPSGGHFVVGYGIKDSTIYYMDPWRGEGYKIADYSWVLSDNEHTWDATNVISTSPPDGDSVKLLSPADSSLNQSVKPVFLWQKVTNVTAYRFQCTANASFAVTNKDTIVTGDTTLQLSGLTPGARYYWRVSAVTETTDTTIWSAAWSFTTKTSTRLTINSKDPVGLNICSIEKNNLSIMYTVPYPAQIDIQIYSLQGRLIQTICSSFHQTGRYWARIENVNFALENYIVSIRTGNYRATRLIVSPLSGTTRW